MNTSDQNNHSIIKMIFALVVLFAAVNAQSTSCKTDCCLVVQIWRALGKTTNVSSTNPTGCCAINGGIPGVFCQGDKVSHISWNSQSLDTNTIVNVKKFVTLSTLITHDEPVSCTSTSSQCCWALRVRQLMGLSIKGSTPTSATGCCVSALGVTCTGTSVTRLVITGSSGATGSIPDDIGRLVDLTTLQIISTRQLTGSIPASIQNLKKLTALQLYGNALTGNIGSWIGDFTNLTNLDLSANQLTGPIPPEIVKLRKLTTLNLYTNQLTGAIPDIANMTTLVGLSLQFNRLTGNIEPWIGNLTNLSKLDLAGNLLTGSIPPQIANLRKLSWLHLFGNQLTGTIPDFRNLTTLTYLSLKANNLSGTIPSWLGGLTNLNDLHLANNSFHGSIPSEIGNLQSLYKLDIAYNQLSGAIPPSIGTIQYLMSFVFHNNPSLNGTYTPVCGFGVFAWDTDVIVCGCASEKTPAYIFPPSTTAIECLRNGVTAPLQKRAAVFSSAIGTSKFTCNVDDNLNPFHDCLNSMAAFCNPLYIGIDATRIARCKDIVNVMTSGMNQYWQNVRTHCGQWSWNNLAVGLVGSPNCIAANAELQRNAFYTTPSGIYQVSPALTNSVNAILWGNPILRG